MNTLPDKWAFYAAFEDRYRGSFEEIKIRVTDYIPDILDQPASLAKLPAIDLGAGRGEWLAVLVEHGVEAIGVDQNPVAVDRARATGLNIQLGDVFEFLGDLHDSSARLVSAFHLIEHLSWELQLQLFKEGHRVLAPGGILIVEWPNIENLTVATQSFWMDPTHVRPLPLHLASFMAEFAGFPAILARRFRPPSVEGRSDARTSGSARTVLSRISGFNSSGSLESDPEFRSILTAMRAGQDIALLCRK